MYAGIPHSRVHLVGCSPLSGHGQPGTASCELWPLGRHETSVWQPALAAQWMPLGLGWVGRCPHSCLQMHCAGASDLRPSSPAC